MAFAAYGYDLAGRLLTASNSDAVMTRTYDLTGRLISERQQHLNVGAVVFDTTVSRGYEANGMLSSVTDAFGTTEYGYNQRGLLKDVNRCCLAEKMPRGGSLGKMDILKIRHCNQALQAVVHFIFDEKTKPEETLG